LVEVVEDQAFLFVSLREPEIVMELGDVVALGLSDFISNVGVVFCIVLHTWVFVAFFHKFEHGRLFISLGKLFSERSCVLGLERSEELNVA